MKTHRKSEGRKRGKAKQENKNNPFPHKERASYPNIRPYSASSRGWLRNQGYEEKGVEEKQSRIPALGGGVMERLWHQPW